MQMSISFPGGGGGGGGCGCGREGGREGEMGQSVIELNSSGLEIGNDDRY